ncbi:hypothetical protein [Streptomyces sp. NBC_00199]|uniref:hypothetical protein n=1 Tax=Streptomyces sp. NBC_00199 TaxID=2975678 RepID=UPI0022516C62|nr:hypothetical protein [Streptomyces sp. NBC_00199]MCX5262435.1 hypothetical protein [Streptomyces sp. NBC_00199]
MVGDDVDAVQALYGRGPLPAAAGAGLRVMASAPLHGGELPATVDEELADLIRLGLTPAQACVLCVASCPGVMDDHFIPQFLLQHFAGQRGKLAAVWR